MRRREQPEGHLGRRRPQELIRRCTSSWPPPLQRRSRPSRLPALIDAVSSSLSYPVRSAQSSIASSTVSSVVASLQTMPFCHDDNVVRRARPPRTLLKSSRVVVHVQEDGRAAVRRAVISPTSLME